MAKSPTGLIQNYFDALISSYFKTAQDGRKLFCPRVVWGRGYAIASEQDYERVVREIKVFWVIGLVLWLIGAVALGPILNGYLPLFISAAFLIILYFIAGAPYLVRGMQPSDERLSLQESYTSQALAYSPALLWLFEIISLVGAGVGIVMLVVDSSNWLTALAWIVGSGLLAAAVMWMIVLRRRASRQSAPHS